MIFPILIAVIAVIIVLDYLAKKKVDDKNSHVKGPTPWPLVGNIPEFVGVKSKDLLKFTLDVGNKYGAVNRMWVFNRYALMSPDPRDIEAVLGSHKHITKNNIYDILVQWLGTGLLMSAGQKWHSRRKVITPTFHFKILEQFVDVFNQQGQILIEKLKTKADGQSINIMPLVCVAALDIIAETAMGTKVHAQTKTNNPYSDALIELTNMIGDRIAGAWQRSDLVYAITNPLGMMRLKKNVRILHEFTERVIDERREALEKSVRDGTFKPNEAGDDGLGVKKRMALLDVLLQSTINGQPLTNADIREEVDTFMFEGHDTTTAAISFALYELARNPHVQQKLFEEIKEVLGTDPNSQPTLREYNDLKYTELVIKEALRLYPSVPFIARTFQEDAEINGKFLPAGSDFIAGIYTMQHDAKYFPDPEKFDPERYEPKEGVPKVDPFSYVPFSAGPRNCIGQKFAILEMKSMISKVVRNFEVVNVGHELQMAFTLVLRSLNGVHIGLKPRVY